MKGRLSCSKTPPSLARPLYRRLTPSPPAPLQAPSSAPRRAGRAHRACQARAEGFLDRGDRQAARVLRPARPIRGRSLPRCCCALPPPLADQFSLNRSLRHWPSPSMCFSLVQMSESERESRQQVECAARSTGTTATKTGQPMRRSESFEPGGCSAFRSHSNGIMLTHPARAAGCGDDGGPGVSRRDDQEVSYLAG